MRQGISSLLSAETLAWSKRGASPPAEVMRNHGIEDSLFEPVLAAIDWAMSRTLRLLS
jgi:hypothetical protein